MASTPYTIVLPLPMPMKGMEESKCSATARKAALRFADSMRSSSGVAGAGLMVDEDGRRIVRREVGAVGAVGGFIVLQWLR